MLKMTILLNCFNAFYHVLRIHILFLRHQNPYVRLAISTYKCLFNLIHFWEVLLPWLNNCLCSQDFEFYNLFRGPLPGLRQILATESSLDTMKNVF